MKNTDFYTYCRDHRKTETDPNKQQALTDVYNNLRECGVTKAGVKQFVDHMIYQKSNEPAKVAAYRWLLGVFDGASESVVPDGQMQLF
jgi:hypothetical protein